MATDPEAWLLQHGYDPEGDLGKTRRNRWGKKAMAMQEAFYAGELGVCHFTWDRGGNFTRPTIRTRGGATAGCPYMLHAPRLTFIFC